MDFTITDFADREIREGTTVRMWWDSKMEAQDGDGTFGVVTGLGEWEGDVDSEGRSVGIPPDVTVQWENGTTGSFRTSEWEFESGYYYHEPVLGRVEELDVVQGPLRNEVPNGR